MTHELIISVSGLRGIVGDSLTPEIASRYARAFCSTIEAGPVLIARDGRTTGKMLAKAIASSVEACGRDVIFADVAATPTVGVLVRELSAAGGIQVSASHNPPPYNGMKLFGPDGRVLGVGNGQAVKEAFVAGTGPWCPWNKVGSTCEKASKVERHLKLVHSQSPVERIREKQFSVVLDANHGAGAALGKPLLESLGCQVMVLGEDPNGEFAHPPEPTLENLVSVGAKVREAGAAIGFCVDPDADRLAIIDEQGTYLGEEYTLAICLDYVLQSRKGVVVINCATSRMCEDVAARHGNSVLRSAVGEANVCDLMIANQAVFGGEGNGGPIDPRVGYVRDSFVGMATILGAMATSGKSISQLAAGIPRYEIVKTKVDMSTARLSEAMAAIVKRFPEAETNYLDGLRLQWPDGWLLVRGSNTEPIVRAIAEAPTRERAKGLCEEAAKVLRLYQ
jgi:phosphomannomutase